MGVVFRARDTMLARDIALKLVGLSEVAGPHSGPMPDSTRGPLREARAAAAINHPNAVSVFDVGEVEGVAYIAMELIEGKTLRSFVGLDEPSIDVRIGWLLDIARALAAAHARSLVHRDVKPENVMIRNDGTPKVLDFGIARHCEPEGGEMRSTGPGAIVGTPAYMAPEQLRGERPDARADQFSWGVVAYELLSGKMPWGAWTDHIDTLSGVRANAPIPLCDWNYEIDAGVDAVVRRAIALAPGERFSSMDELIRALESFSGVATRSSKAPMVSSARAASVVSTPETEATPERAKCIGGRYLPRRLIFRGTRSSVYEVEDIHTREHWALKMLHRADALDPAALDRFRREARIASLVKSQHIVRVVDADTDVELDGAPFIVMELLEGQSLAEISGNHPQPPEVVLDWLRQAAEGLAEAHALSIAHRNLKPENLFLTQRPGAPSIVKILDFGMAKLNAIDGAHRTVAGALVGTPLYMAPEQAAGDSLATGVAIDVWAIGMLTFRLLSGRDYWSAPSVAHLLSHIINTPLRSPASLGLDLGTPFDDWFARSCHRDASARFASVADQIDALTVAFKFRPGRSETAFTREPPDKAPGSEPRTAKTLRELSLTPTTASFDRVPQLAKAPARNRSFARTSVAVLSVLGIAAAGLGAALPRLGTRVQGGSAVTERAPSAGPISAGRSSLSAPKRALEHGVTPSVSPVASAIVPLVLPAVSARPAIDGPARPLRPLTPKRPLRSSSRSALAVSPTEAPRAPVLPDPLADPN